MNKQGGYLEIYANPCINRTTVRSGSSLEDFLKISVMIKRLTMLKVKTR